MKINSLPQKHWWDSSFLKSQSDVRYFTTRFFLTNCRLPPYKAMLCEIKSWNGCHLAIFLLCNIYFMFALEHSDARELSTLPILRQKSVEVLVNRFNTFPWVVNFSFHIFPSSSSHYLGCGWNCQEACLPPPTPLYPWFWSSLVAARAAEWNSLSTAHCEHWSFALREMSVEVAASAVRLGW